MYNESDKLVCVRGGLPKNAGHTSEKPLVEGSIYVISEWEAPRWEGDVWGVRVVGNRTFDKHGVEVFWDATRFRKLSDMQNEARTRKQQEQPV